MIKVIWSQLIRQIDTIELPRRMIVSELLQTIFEQFGTSEQFGMHGVEILRKCV